MKLSSLSLLVLLAAACLRLGDSTNPPLYRSPYEPNNAFGFLLNSGQCSTTYQYKFIKVDCITCAYQVYRWLFFGLCCSAFGMRFVSGTGHTLTSYLALIHRFFFFYISLSS